MTRTYTKTKRAEQQSETHQRIVEATVQLHTEVGPLRTTISMIAERAGVQRHTVYAHFPDDRSLQMACSGHVMSNDPLPSPQDWQGVNDPSVKLRKALGALYQWYARNAQLMANVVRDAEVLPITREVTELRAGPAIQAISDSVSGGLGAKGKAALVLAMSFHTWRTLIEEAGIDQSEAVDLMASTIVSADA
jgi:AcrR family transcriptional regulator